MSESEIPRKQRSIKLEMFQRVEYGTIAAVHQYAQANPVGLKQSTGSLLTGIKDGKEGNGIGTYKNKIFYG